MPIPADLDAVLDHAWRQMRAVPGFLTEREGRFPALAAAMDPARGAILEIGSFKGKSTVGLATVVKHYHCGPLVAVDPFTSPSSTDPDLHGLASSYPEFVAALHAAGVHADVEVHRAYSREVASDWARPIRLLWIDGYHTYAGAKADLELFRRHLAPGAIVALHDALGVFEGPIRVALEVLLGSDDFGPAGFCGTIAWAQFRPHDGCASRFRSERSALARRVARLLRHDPMGQPPSRLRSLRRRFWRAQVPHGAVVPARWIDAVRV